MQQGSLIPQINTCKYYSELNFQSQKNIYTQKKVKPAFFWTEVEEKEKKSVSTL